jgi:hypothetical protein
VIGVLFVCVHNARRSQMAAALRDHHAQGRVRVNSAGSAPANEINPAVRAAMAELGLDLSREFPKPLTDDAVRATQSAEYENRDHALLDNDLLHRMALRGCGEPAKRLVHPALQVGRAR